LEGKLVVLKDTRGRLLKEALVISARRQSEQKKRGKNGKFLSAGRCDKWQEQGDS
jgi:hypothetical protein